MFQIISENPLPKVSQMCVRFHATSDVEANEIVRQTPENTIVRVDANNMPYTEEHDDLVEEDQPILTKFRTGKAFKLAVYNFDASENIPFVGFSVERIMNEEDLYVEGSSQILDPAKNTLTKPTIAIVSLLHIFNKKIDIEIKRASALIAEASVQDENVVSFNAEGDRRMMDAALNAVHNVQLALYQPREEMVETMDPEEQKRIEEERSVKPPSMGIDGLFESLSPTLNAKDSFYDSLFEKMADLYEPSIRGLANRVALGRFGSLTI